MSKHRIRDLQITSTSTLHVMAQIHYVLFHFLRNAGWTWLWECDGYAGDSPNRVPDGNMEAAGAGSWAPLLGASLAKVSTPVHSGTQALSVDSGAVNAGTESSALTSMENLTKYHLAIWALNNTGQPWNVDVDLGTGYVTVGTIPSDGAYGLYHFNFTTAGAGTRKLRVVDNLNSQGTIYLSDVLVIKSYFDYNPSDAYRSGIDGATINPNQFSSGSYTFVAGDIGKVVCIWDPTNPKNSGAYKITAVPGGVATLELRSGSAAFVAQSGLSWRMINLAAAPENPSGTDNGQRGAGFGLQSPHASGWRLFIRQCQHGHWSVDPRPEITGIWGAPSATDFDFSTGTFYRTGPSTQNTKQSAYYLVSGAATTWPGMHGYFGGSDPVGGTKRFFLMTDDTGSFVSLVHWDSTNLYNACPIIGYMGSSPYLPDVEAWALFASWGAGPTGSYTEMNWQGTGRQFSALGTMIGPDGVTKDAIWGQYGYWNSTADVVTQSNAGDNPWSANEWLHKPIAVRDPDGVTGYPAEMTIDIGVLQGRQNLTHLSTFDSNAYLHFDNGFTWEWMGESILP